METSNKVDCTWTTELRKEKFRQIGFTSSSRERVVVALPFLKSQTTTFSYEQKSNVPNLLDESYDTTAVSLHVLGEPARDDLWYPI